jgi:hypothetical protein
MSLTEVVAVRLPARERFLYEKEATYHGQSLGAYLRERLERSESLSSQLPHTMPQPSAGEQGILLEMLLLLRSISPPEKIHMVQCELKRLNIPVWEQKPQNAF